MQFCTFSELTTSIPSTELTEKWAYKGNYKIQKYIISCDQKYKSLQILYICEYVCGCIYFQTTNIF